MKRVVSVSLGASKRNHKVETTILGEEFSIERIGTDGDVKKAKQMIRELDGKVAAIGLGGTDLYIHSEKKRYAFRESKALRDCAPNTPVTDGSYLKKTLEYRLIYYVRDQLGIDFKGKKVLLMCAVDRHGMARALAECNADLKCGDLVFTLGIPKLINSFRTVTMLASVLCPIIVQLPMKWVYPTGAAQDKPNTKFHRFFDGIDIVCGDYLFIKKYMPENLQGKIIITNTVTPEDIEILRARGAKMLITGTPEMEGRSFGTNVMEGVIAAFSGQSPDQMGDEEFLKWVDKVSYIPRVVELN
ncbi:MAG: quinate 5-dehydrogenase [Firmicutes bacterium]|nr:quinate 5-dehydrogenase [Bacillota bacterium]